MLLNPIEFDITRELISIALANAADSFSRMANEQILIKGYELTLLPQQDLGRFDTFYEPETPSVLLSTEIKGSISAKSYLIFSLPDASRTLGMFGAATPAGACASLSEVQQAILLELDNIVTAAVVTQLANLLEVFSYGDVPFIQQVPEGTLLAYLGSEVEDYEVMLQIKAQFVTTTSQATPYFICFFKADFLAAIKKLVNEKKHLSLVKKQ
jgi:chemotaxis protein CheY-P-specific phosphatase CheC